MHNRTPTIPAIDVSRRSTALLFSLCAFLILCGAQRLSAQLVPIGDEFYIPSSTTSCAGSFEAAMAPDGKFVVVWLENSFKSFSRRFDEDAVPLAVDEPLRAPETFLSIATDIEPDGDFIVAWADNILTSKVIEAQRYSSDGMPAGSLLTVSNTTEENLLPEVALAPDGTFVVVWRKGPFGTTTIQKAMFDPSNLPVGGPTTVSTGAEGEEADVAMSLDGQSFVVVWEDSDGAGDSDVFRRVYDSSGNPTTVPLVVNTYTTLSQIAPAVAFDAEGGYQVTWSGRSATSQKATEVARFGSDHLLDEIERIDASDERTGSDNSIAVSNDGATWFAAWTDTTSGDGIHERDIYFAARGVSETPMTTMTTGNQERPKVVMDDRERVLAIWRTDPTGTCGQLAAQRFQLYQTPSTFPHQDGVHSLAARGAWKYYVYFPNEPAEVHVELTGLPGSFPQDADLYVRFGNFPDADNYDCRSQASGGSDESCTVLSSGPPVLIGVNGYDTGGTIPFTLNVTKSPVLFMDGFESGDTLEWTATAP